MADKKVGTITHYFDHLGVGIVKLEDKISIGDKIRIQGSTTNLEQEVASMQLDHVETQTAKKGQEVGLKVNDKVREGDDVFLI